MLRKLLVAIVLLLHIGLLYAQNTQKMPPSPFSFQNGKTSVRTELLPNIIAPLNMGNVNTQNNNGINNPTNAGVDSVPMLQNLNSQDLVKQQELEKDSLKNLPDTVYAQFETDMSEYASKLVPYTLKLFYTLMTLTVIITFITQLIMGNGFKDIVISIGYMFFYAGIWVLIIENYIDWGNWLINYFKDIGANVSGVDFQPANVLNYGINYITSIFDKIGVINIGQSIMYIALCIPTLYFIVRMVDIYLYTLLETLIVGKLSIIYLGFGGLTKMEGYAKKPIMYCLSAGLKLMFLQLFFGTVLGLIKKYSTMPASINVAIIMFVISCFLLGLVKNIPGIVQSFLMGTPTPAGIGTLSKAVRTAVSDTVHAVMTAYNGSQLLKNANELASSSVPPNNQNKWNHSFFDREQPTSSPSSSGSGMGGSAFNSNNSFSGNNSASGNANPSTNQNVNTDTASTQKPTANNFAELNPTSGNPAGNKDTSTSELSKQSLGTGTNNTQSNANNTNTASKGSTTNTSKPTLDNPALHAIKTAGHVVGALLKNDFSVNNANKELSYKLQQKKNQDMEQHRLWDRIASGKSPENVEQIPQYIEHGTAMHNNPEYVERFQSYLDNRSTTYNQAQENISDFEQQANAVINLSNGIEASNTPQENKDNTTNHKENKHE